jgi:subtilisin family serine protease
MKILKFVFAGTAVLFIAVLCLDVDVTAGPELDVEPGRYVPNEVLVKFKDSAAQSVIDACIRTSLGARIMKRFDMRGKKPHMHRFFNGTLVRLKLPDGVDMRKVVETLNKLPFVEYAEPNYFVKPALVPDDTDYDQQYAHEVMCSENAWNIRTDATTGTGEDIVVAVLDTGCDYTHEDLGNNIWTNPGEIPGNDIDDDGNGYVDDVHGWDFFWGDNDPMTDGEDIRDHGTHCAGIIGAIGNNGVGVCGICWKVKLMILKFEDRDDCGTAADAIEAIQYAASFGVRILSNSYHLEGDPGQNRAFRDALEASGALFIAAAGNANLDNDRHMHPPCPTSLPSENIISVAASDSRDKRAAFSSWGLHSVDMAAPGATILAPTRDNTYSSWSGTSMSTPYVAGAAALMLAEYPGLTNAQIKHKLLASVDNIPDFENTTVSGGRLNLFKALQPLVGTPALDELDYSDNDGDYELNWTAAANASRYELQEGTVHASVSEDAENESGLWILHGFYRSSFNTHDNSAYSYHSGDISNARNVMEFAKPITVLPGGKISFWCSYNIEIECDYAYIEVSENGHLWEKLVLFTDEQSDWKKMEVGLSDYKGKAIYLRFRYCSDSGGDQGGFYVDDISMENVEYTEWNTLTDSESTLTYSVTANPDGTYQYRVRGLDSHDVCGPWSNVERIVVATGALQVDTEILPDGKKAEAYSCFLAASGGSGAYTWSMESGDLPSGLSLDTATGEISGTPAAEGNSSFTVKVTDGASAHATKTLDMKIGPSGGLRITTVALLAAEVNKEYSAELTAAGGGPPYTWSIDSGELPAGLSMNATSGTISGTPTAVETCTFTVRVEDDGSEHATREFMIEVIIKVIKKDNGCAMSGGPADPGALIPYAILLLILTAIVIRRGLIHQARSENVR